MDFKAIVAKAREICTPLAVFIKPITGRPPAILPVWDTEFMKKYGDARAAGRSPDEARMDATFTGMTNGALGTLPIGAIMRPGVCFVAGTQVIGVRSINHIFNS